MKNITLLVIFVLLNHSINHGQGIHEDYSNLSISISGGKLFTTNEDNSIGYEIYNPTYYELGIAYQIWEKKSWSIELQASYRTYELSNSIIVDGSEYGSTTGIDGILTFGPFTQYKLNVIPQYKIYELSIGIGPELIIYPEDFVEGTVFAGDEVLFTDNGNSKDGWAYIGFTGHIEYRIPFKYLQLAIFAQYHWQPEDLYTVNVITEGLLVSPNTKSQHKITGNYFQIGLKFSPAKKLLGF